MVWVANGAGVGGLRMLSPPPFLLSALACSSGEDCNGGSGIHRRWSRFAENVHSAHGFHPHPAACRSILRKLAARLYRQWSLEGNARSAGAVCARRVNNQWTFSTLTDLLPFERCQPALGEVTSPTVQFVFFFCDP